MKYELSQIKNCIPGEWEYNLDKISTDAYALLKQEKHRIEIYLFSSGEVHCYNDNNNTCNVFTHLYQAKIWLKKIVTFNNFK